MEVPEAEAEALGNIIPYRDFGDGPRDLGTVLFSLLQNRDLGTVLKSLFYLYIPCNILLIFAYNINKLTYIY